MLYIAEVKRQTKGFIGGTKTVLQLLACQRNDQSWSTVQGEETIPYEDGGQLGDGALVMVNLANRQVQGEIEPAGTKIVGLLQSLSRAIEKSRSQEEEIEEWRQSLTYQAQELNRREMELEASREQLDRQEEELERLEQQRQELEASLAQLQQQREELGGQPATGNAVDAAQAGQLQQLANTLAAALTPTAQASTQATALQAAIAQQQSDLEKLASQPGNAGGGSNLTALRQRAWQEQTNLEQGRSQLTICRSAIEVKQGVSQHLNQQIQALGELRDALVRVAIGSNLVRLGQPVDTEALARLSDSELEARVATLEQDLNKVRPFVSDQEEELKLQLQSVEELQQHLQDASESDRASIATELEEERDRYRFLEETLLGQRRTIKVREDVLAQHQQALSQRRGEATAAEAAEDNRVDLGPSLNQLENLRAVAEEELRKLEAETERLQQSLPQAEELVKLRARQQEAQVRELSQAEATAAPTDLGQAYERQRALLQSLQEQANAIATPLQQTGNAQQAIAQLQELIQSLTAVAAT